MYSLKGYIGDIWYPIAPNIIINVINIIMNIIYQITNVVYQIMTLNNISKQNITLIKLIDIVMNVIIILNKILNHIIILIPKILIIINVCSCIIQFLPYKTNSKRMGRLFGHVSWAVNYGFGFWVWVSDLGFRRTFCTLFETAILYMSTVRSA